MSEHERGPLLPSIILAVGPLLVAAGYWGPWVAHKAAALVILGLDLAEYVKFLPEYRTGQIRLWREGFYLPLLALSLTLSFVAWRPKVGWPAFLRALAWLASIPAALAMLPPAWSPPILRLPEFRWQVIAIGICLAAAFLAPMGRRYHMTWACWGLALLQASAALVPLAQFWRIRPALDRLYGRPVALGWGPFTMAFGLALTAFALIALAYANGRGMVSRPGRASDDASQRSAPPLGAR